MPPIPIHIVTGATRGIGRAVATALVARGFRVIAVGRSIELLNSLSKKCGQLVTTVQADLATDAGVERISAAIADVSRIESIVHSAGSLVPLEPYDQVKTSELTDHFRIHVGAPVALFQTVSQRHRIKRMMFIDSYSACQARHGWAAYSIIKAAAQMAARCAAKELPETQTIRVYPGAVNTQIVDAVLASDTETSTAFAAMLKNGQVAEPEEIARFLVALVADAPDKLLSSREAFDYNKPADRVDVLGEG